MIQFVSFVVVNKIVEGKYSQEYIMAKQESMATKQQQNETVDGEEEHSETDKLEEQEAEKKRQEELEKQEDEKKQKEELAKLEEEKDQQEIGKQEEESKWVEGYNLINKADMFKAGDTIYWEEGDGYEPAFIILEVASDITLETGYVSKKAMKVQDYLNESDVFWKDIDLTLQAASKQGGVKYYSKGYKFNP